MDTSPNPIIHDFPPFFKVYKDGRVEKYQMLPVDPAPSPTGVDPNTGVQSKDVLISPETGVKVRIFMPTNTRPGQKLPLLVHYHGGGFCVGSALDGLAKNFLTSLVSEGNIIAISVDYRLAPEHPLPIAYDDSWAGLQWVGSHSNGSGPDPWINEYADLNRVFLTGESAGANIAHHVVVRAGAKGLSGLKIVGVIIVHPFFVGKETDEMYKFMCPTSSGCDDDPRLNPAADPNLEKMGCERVMVLVAEKDRLRSRGEAYYETLEKSGWGGRLVFFETKGEDHCFHMFKNNEDAQVLKRKMIDFIKLES